jgi:hypothetical protein
LRRRARRTIPRASRGTFRAGARQRRLPCQHAPPPPPIKRPGVPRLRLPSKRPPAYSHHSGRQHPQIRLVVFLFVLLLREIEIPWPPPAPGPSGGSAPRSATYLPVSPRPAPHPFLCFFLRFSPTWTFWVQVVARHLPDELLVSGRRCTRSSRRRAWPSASARCSSSATSPPTLKSGTYAVDARADLTFFSVANIRNLDHLVHATRIRCYTGSVCSESVFTERNQVMRLIICFGYSNHNHKLSTFIPAKFLLNLF